MDNNNIKCGKVVLKLKFPSLYIKQDEDDFQNYNPRGWL